MDQFSAQGFESGRHPVNVGHLVMGMAFAGLVLVWAVLQADLVELDETRWLLPLPWVVAGAVGLVAATANARRPRRDPSREYGDTTAADPSQMDTDTTAEPSSENPGDAEPTQEIR